MKRKLKSGSAHYGVRTLNDYRMYNGDNLRKAGHGPGRAPLLPLDAAVVSCRMTRMEIAFLTSRGINSPWASHDTRSWEHKGAVPALRAALEILSNPLIGADSARVAEFFYCPLSESELAFDAGRPRLGERENRECTMSMRLAQRHIDYATQLGGGNFSRGIRQAIADLRWLM